MKILSASQIRSADAFTIANEPISSIDLMERAATACISWLIENISIESTVRIFCGPGNNGGDGLAIARMLLTAGYKIQVYILRITEKYSPDFLENERRIHDSFPSAMNDIQDVKHFPKIKSNDVVIDALFGTGLSKIISGLCSALIIHINSSGAKIISIDMPSGLFADEITTGTSIIQANHTLSFQFPKLTFMFPGSEKYVGAFHLLDIGLDNKFIESVSVENIYLTQKIIQPLLKKKNKFSHKGNNGHALIVAGSKGKMGAAVLAVKGCLRSGAGLVSATVPNSGIEIMQVSCPEAMVVTGKNDLKKYNAIGIGPGLGTDAKIIVALEKLLKHVKVPLVIDADALNILSANKKLMKRIPAGSILTPHPKEFEKLAGKTNNDFERHTSQIGFSKKYKCFVVLKGAHTCITTPEGISYFNSSGNPGMAKGGSGDILTGMITSLLAQDYSPEHSAMIGVYLHGLAGDLAAKEIGMDGMIAGDISGAITLAWKQLRASVV